MAATLFSCNPNTLHSTFFLGVRRNLFNQPIGRIINSTARKSSPKFLVVAATEGSAKSGKSKETLPSWASPDSEEPPPWAKNESAASASSDDQTVEIPFYVYLLSSAIIAIAAIGSVFEYVNQKPVFGILNSDSIFYAPVLGFFAFTGIPLSGFLWFKSVQVANKEAEEQDKKDGYL
ncbi:uncharacterized protein [Euphorbia lathyris]|uniref:uncharacterized protein n=1 Tax=Euphorbia lathyris TaxID=212925 RepID=UPI0033133441